MNYSLIQLGDFIHNTFEPIKGALLSGYPIKVGICGLQTIFSFRREIIFVHITEVSNAIDISRWILRGSTYISIFGIVRFKLQSW